MLLPSQKDVRRQRTERFPWRQHRSLLDPGARFREPAESRVLIATFASSAHSSGDSVWTSSRRPGDRFTVGRVRTFSAMSHSGPGPGWFPSRRPRGRRTNRALQRADDALANSPWGRSRLYSLLSLCVSLFVSSELGVAAKGVFSGAAPPLSQNGPAATATQPAPSRAALPGSARSLAARSWRDCCLPEQRFSPWRRFTPPIPPFPRISFCSVSHQRFQQQQSLLSGLAAGTLLLTQKGTFRVDRVCEFSYVAFWIRAPLGSGPELSRS